MQIASYSDIGGRRGNEDSIRYETISPHGLCLAVADGLGGHGGGELASKTACDAICGHWNGHAAAELAAELVCEAHRSVQSVQTRLCAMKSTVVVLLAEAGRVAWAHIGDSRLYHFHNGVLVFQTIDHSASRIAVMLGDITPDQIRFHEDRNRVLRALGQEGDVNVETHEEELACGSHAFLLCTDGFWEYVLEDEMESDLQAAKDLEDWLCRMRNRLAERVPEDNDNNSAAVVWL